jgi:hypothetical protein
VISGTSTTHGEVRNLYKVVVEKPQMKRPCDRHRIRWEDNIKTYLSEVGRECLC